MKILISRPDKIGDVILALHGVKQFKRMLPEHEVYMHVSEYTAPLVRNVKWIDGCLTLDADLKSYHFDAVVDLMAKVRTAKLYFMAGIKCRIGNLARWFSFMYNRARCIRRSRALMNEAEYDWQLISLLDPGLKNVRLVDSLSLEDFSEIVDFAELSDYFVLMPGITASAIGWEIRQWKQLGRILAERTNKSVLFLLGPAEEKIAAEFKAEAESFAGIHVKIIDDFKCLIGVLKNAAAYVGTSTGVTHLASVVGTGGVALYSEVQSLHPNRWMPFNSSVQVLSLSKNPTAEDVCQVLLGSVRSDLQPFHRESISAFVVCCNEENNIRRCLESLKWCDEIVIVDSGSTDRTLEICREYTDKIFCRDWAGHRLQKQFALEQCSCEWVLNIDSDEEVSTYLRGEILEVLSRSKKNGNEIKGYDICRVVYFLGRWWDRGGWYPEYRRRFFRREFTRWGGIDPHEKALVDGPTKRLRGQLYHYTYSDFSHQIDSLNKHSSLMAKQLHSRGRRCGLFNLWFNPLLRFVKFYILKRGFREGVPGLIIACLEAFYVFLKYIKLWELQRLHPADKES